MPWHVANDPDRCSPEEPWAVIRDGDDEVEGCHATRTEALEQLAALYAAEAGDPDTDTDEPDDDTEDAAGGTPFHALLVVEDWETEDRRIFHELEVREQVTWPFMIQDRSLHGLPGDASSWIAGAFETIERDPREATRFIGRGRLMDNARGAEAEELIRGGLRSVSMDGAGGEVYYDVRQVDAGGFPINVLERISGTRIMGGTATPFQAVGPTVIWFDDEPEPAIVAATRGEAPPITEEPEVVDDGMPLEALLASGGGPERPPLEWFTNPMFGPDPDHDPRLGVGPAGSYGCHLTITDEGQVYGHIACWDVPHIGMDGREVFAPRSASLQPYGVFMSGQVICADGTRVSTGVIAANCGHAPRSGITAGQAQAFYDNTGTAVADVTVGEDRHGIWCAGAIRPHITEDDLRALIGGDVSGDWRGIGGLPEMVAIALVNTAGFPVPRPSVHIAASGELVALVAAAGPAWMPRRSKPALVREAAQTPPMVMIGSRAELEQLIDERIGAAFFAAGVAEGPTIGTRPPDLEQPTQRRHVSAPPLRPSPLSARAREIIAKTEREQAAAG